MEVTQVLNGYEHVKYFELFDSEIQYISDGTVYIDGKWVCCHGYPGKRRKVALSLHL